MKTILDTVRVESEGWTIAVCPVCRHENVHLGQSFRMDGAYLDCRDDRGDGGLFLPFEGECGHHWGIGFANHKGVECVRVFLTPSTFPAEGPR
jgi:hypothetical protein